MNVRLKEYINNIDVKNIPASRQELLGGLISYITNKLKNNESIGINFICTHNSRRSQLGQVWCYTMASYYNIEDVLTFSGGTVATAVHPMIIKTLEDQFFDIDIIDETDNSLYSITFDDFNPQYIFSKKFTDSTNPEDNFIAVLTCSQAQKDCPVVTGADKIIAITYDDPKISDGSDDQERIYRERSIQIATEMKYVFSRVSK